MLDTPMFRRLSFGDGAQCAIARFRRQRFI